MILHILIDVHARTHETLATFEKVPGHMQQINHTVWYNYVHNYITCAHLLAIFKLFTFRVATVPSSSLNLKTILPCSGSSLGMPVSNIIIIWNVIMTPKGVIKRPQIHAHNCN